MYKLIIVDDDELIRKGLERVIKWHQLGFLVEGTFSNADAALEYIKKEPVDVILTDIKMPEMSGLELIGQAKNHQKSIKSVIISGYSEFELAKKALLLKVEDYLLKPLGEEEIEAAFKKLKEDLDRENAKGTLEGKQKINREYELMGLLSSQGGMASLFEAKAGGKQCYELLFIRFHKHREDSGSRQQLLCCEAMVKAACSQWFFCSLEGMAAALVPPSQLNGLLMRLKREFSKYSGVYWQISIGREVYSEAEVVSSYWSAVNLKEEGSGKVLHYERERNVYKREWDMIQELKNEMIKSFENGSFQDIDRQAEEINRVLEHYESKDLYYFYCNIIMKMLKYFDMEGNRAAYFFAHQDFGGFSKEPQEKEQLKKNFKQDLDAIRKALWENSDSMRNLMVSKAKKLMEERYGEDDLSLAFVANQLNISYGYLSTIFTKTVGCSFKAYLVEVRMEKARTLLLSRNYRIYEIAQMVGYKNPRYFTDAFKKYYHYSPVDYIARFRGEGTL